MATKNPGAAGASGRKAAPAPEHSTGREAPASFPFKLPFLSELKRRNVFRMAILYVIACWVILEPTHVVFHMLEVPAWMNRLVLILMAIGLPLVLLFSWIYEVTPQGLKLTSEVDRAQSITRDTGRKLDRTIIVVLSVALLYFVTDKFWLSRRAGTVPAGAASVAPAVPQPATTIAATDKSIAVLPFVDMSEKKDQEYFSDGLSEELIDLLAKVPDLHVPARTSSFYFKGKSEDIASIAQKLRVAHVLEGSVRKAGSRLRVTAQLIRADNGYHLWSETYDRNLKDVFEVQDEIAGAVLVALKAQLLPSQQAVNAARTESSKAHDHYLLGMLHMNRDEPDSDLRAAGEFREAIALDPRYAIAHAGLAMAEAYRADANGDQAMMQEAVAAADQAVALGPAVADTYAIRGTIRVSSLWDWSGAQADLEKAIALDPGSASAQRAYAKLLAARGRLTEAIATARKAVEADPLSVAAWDNLGAYQQDLGDLASARESLNRALEISPESRFAHFNLGMNEVLDGHAQDALQRFRHHPVKEARLFGIALSEQALRNRRESQQALKELIAVGAQSVAYQIAEVYAFSAQADKAFEWLERAYKQHDGGMADIRNDPFLRNLRADPRFKAMLVKMRLDGDPSGRDLRS